MIHSTATGTRSIAIALGCLLCFAIPAAAQLSPLEKFVTTREEAFGLMPADLLATGDISNAQWSFDGKFILAVRQTVHLTPQLIHKALARGATGEPPPPGEIGIVLWNSRDHNATQIWKGPLGIASVESIHWQPTTNSALVQISQIIPPQGPGSEPTAVRCAFRTRWRTARPSEVSRVAKAPRVGIRSCVSSR